MKPTGEVNVTKSDQQNTIKYSVTATFWNMNEREADYMDRLLRKIRDRLVAGDLVE